MRRRDFERAVGQAMDGLPASIRRALRHVRVEVADHPTALILRQAGLKRSDELFGWYEGTPLEAAFSRRRDLIEEIKTTLRHEVGHHLGLDEDDLARMGLD